MDTQKTGKFVGSLKLFLLFLTYFEYLMSMYLEKYLVLSIAGWSLPRVPKIFGWELAQVSRYI